MSRIHVVQILVSLFLFAQAGIINAFQQAPVAHWKFDSKEGSTVSDSVGNNHGSLKGSAALASGQPGKALSCSEAGDYVQIGRDYDAPIIPINSDFCISVWINTEDRLAHQGIYGHYSTNSINYFAYWMEINTGRLRFGLGNGTTSEIFDLSGDYVLKSGKWVHWTVVRSGSKLKCFVNGEHVASKDITLTGEFPQTPKNGGATGVKKELIGGMFSGEHRRFLGRIDDLRVWRTALSEEDVKAVFYDAMIDVKEWYPAVADGLTDDGPSINQAIVDANGDGKFILLNDGEFLTNETIRMLAGTNLYGLEATLKNAQDIASQHADGLLKVESHCEVHGLNLDGSNLGINGIQIKNAHDVLVENCKISNLKRITPGLSGIYGMTLRQTRGEFKNVRVVSCDIDNVSCTGDVSACRGIFIVNGPDLEMSDIVIDQCNISNIYARGPRKDGDCIQVQSYAKEGINWATCPVTISNCSFSNYSKRAIKVMASEVTISNNRVHDVNLATSGTAFTLFGSNCIAESNTVDFSTETDHPCAAVQIDGDNNIVRDNKLTLSPVPLGRSSGLYLQRAYNGHLPTGNTFKDNVVSGGKYGVSLWRAGIDNNSFVNNDFDVPNEAYFNPHNTTNEFANNRISSPPESE